MRAHVRALALALGGLLAATCSLTPGAPEPLHYYALEVGGDSGSVGGRTRAEPAPGAPGVRVRRVHAAAHLGDRLVWRASDVEVGYYEDRRWSEPPAAVLARALERELFQVRGLSRSESGLAPAVDLELTELEIVLPGGRPDGRREVRAALTVRLTATDQTSLLDRSLEARGPVAGDGLPEAVGALGDLLDDLVERAADAVEEALP